MVGGSKWSRFDYKYPGTTPDMVLVRTEPIKRLPFEVSFSKYSLQLEQIMLLKHDLSCNGSSIIPKAIQEALKIVF